MSSQSADHKKIILLPILLVVWNLFDIILHVAVDMPEPLRITGNLVAIVATLIVVLAKRKAFAHDLLLGSAFVVLVVNTVHSLTHGVLPPALIFIGVSIFMLVRWAQIFGAEQEEANSLRVRWWVALIIAVISAAIVGIGVTTDIEQVQLHNNDMVAAEYSSETVV